MGKYNYFSSRYFLGIKLSGQPVSSAKQELLQWPDLCVQLLFLVLGGG